MSDLKEIGDNSGLTSGSNAFTDNDRTIALQMIKKGKEQGRDIKAKLTPDNEILLMENDKPLGLVNRKGVSYRDLNSLAPSILVGLALDLVAPEIGVPYQIGKAVKYLPKVLKTKTAGNVLKYSTGFGLAGAGEEAIANKNAGRSISDNVKERAMNDSIAGAITPVATKGLQKTFNFVKPLTITNKTMSKIYNNYINSGGRKNITSLGGNKKQVNELNDLHNSLLKKEIDLPYNKTIDNLQKKNEEDFIKSLPIKLRKNNEVSIEDMYDAINGVKDTTILAKDIGNTKITEAYNDFKVLGQNAPIDYSFKKSTEINPLSTIKSSKAKKSKNTIINSENIPKNAITNSKSNDILFTNPTTKVIEPDYSNNHILKIKKDLQNDFVNYNNKFKQGVANTPASKHVSTLVDTFGTDKGLTPKNVYDLEKHFRQNLTDIEGKLLADKEAGAVTQNDKDYIRGAKTIFDKRLENIIINTSDYPIELKDSLLNARKTYHDIQKLLSPEDLTVDSDIVNASNKFLNSNENTEDTYIKSLLNKNDRKGLGVYNQLYGDTGRVKNIIGKYGTVGDKQAILKLDDDIKKVNIVGNMFKNKIENTSNENFKPANLVDRKNVFLNSNYVKNNFSKKEINDMNKNFDKYRDTIDVKSVNTNASLIDEFLMPTSSIVIGSGNTGRINESFKGLSRNYNVRSALDKLLKKENFTKEGLISKIINKMNKNNGKLTLPSIIIDKSNSD